MKILIIEDEQPTAEALARMVLELQPESEILGCIASVEEAVEWLQANEAPELLFCDIHLTDGDSFQIFEQVELRAPVVFTTAYDDYAIEAFRVNSVDYLLKPVSREEVERALGKYASYHAGGHTAEASVQRQQSLPAPRVYKQRFMVRRGESLRTMPTEEVAYFRVEEGVVLLTTFSGKRYPLSYSLDQLEEQLDPCRFFRANRQLIVQIEAVEEARPYFKGRLVLQLRPAVEDQVVVSSGRAPAFRDWLEW